MTSPSINDIINQVQLSINEDLGTNTNAKFHSQDVTASLVSENKNSKAQLICREKAILSGKDWFNIAFNLLDKNIVIKWFFDDGDEMSSNDVICEITGVARNILTAERTALNFLQTLSSTATQTALYVNAIKNTTTPLIK